MTPTDPKIDRLAWPHETTIAAERQPEYQPLPVAYANARPRALPNGSTLQPAVVISRWTLTDEERAKVAAGEDLFVAMLTAGGVTPILPTIGADPDTWSEL